MTGDQSSDLTEIRERLDLVDRRLVQLLLEQVEGLDVVDADPAPRTFENTLLALESSSENLDYALSVVRHLETLRHGC